MSEETKSVLAESKHEDKIKVVNPNGNPPFHEAMDLSNDGHDNVISNLTKSLNESKKEEYMSLPKLMASIVSSSNSNQEIVYGAFMLGTYMGEQRAKENMMEQMVQRMQLFSGEQN